MKVLFVVPYPERKAASQRYRVEQLLPVLQNQGIKYKLASFWDQDTYAILYRPGHGLPKGWGLLKGFLRRFLLLFQLPHYKYVFIHREATPVGPPWFEWLAAKVFRRRIIFDFDDAIWLENTSPQNKLAIKYKWPQKIARICQWSYKVSCGNQYLWHFALKYNPQAICLPTVLDTAGKYNTRKLHQTGNVVIGWIGSHATLPYLNLIEPVLQNLERKYNFEFVVITDRPPALQLRSLKYKVWREDTEVEDLLQLDIGVMPLPDTTWAKGKCAFKALQYMALGIPAVVSAVGANMAAVPDGVAGYTCATAQEWHKRLEKLLQDAALRAQLGEAGRHWVQRQYSVQAHRAAFLRLFT